MTSRSPSTFRGRNFRGRNFRGRGFSLIELIVVIALLGIFGLTSATLFSDTLRLMAQADHAQATVTGFDAAVAILRRDVWSASRIDVPDDRTVTLTGSDDTVVTWSVADDTGTMVRRAADAERRWTALAPGMSFGGDGPVLTVRITGAPTRQAGERILVSQVLLAQRRAAP